MSPCNSPWGIGQASHGLGCPLIVPRLGTPGVGDPASLQLRVATETRALHGDHRCQGHLWRSKVIVVAVRGWGHPARGADGGLAHSLKSFLGSRSQKEDTGTPHLPAHMHGGLLGGRGGAAGSAWPGRDERWGVGARGSSRHRQAGGRGPRGLHRLWSGSFGNLSRSQ